jgi:hypothetical protein
MPYAISPSLLDYCLSFFRVLHVQSSSCKSTQYSQKKLLRL